jgi:hypothetical protein
VVSHLGADVVVSSGATVALVVLGLVELALAVFCIVDIIRRPAVAGGRKWVWIVIVVFFGIIGAIIYLAVGRAPAPVPEPSAPLENDTRGRTQAAADLLYGPDAGTAPPQPGSPAPAGAAAQPAAAEPAAPVPPSPPDAPDS